MQCKSDSLTPNLSALLVLSHCHNFIDFNSDTVRGL